MVNKVFFVMLFISCLVQSANAQWYSRSCGVTDIYNCTTEELECLLEWNGKKITLGTVLTSVGVVGSTGFILWSNNTSDWDQSWNRLGIGGLFGICVYTGVPILITGLVRKSHLKKHPGYLDLKSVTLNISPIMDINQYNSNPYYGFSVSLSF